MFCPNCGHKNEDIARFCEECGEQLDQYKDDASGTAADETPAVANINAGNAAPSGRPQPVEMRPAYTQKNTGRNASTGNQTASESAPNQQTKTSGGQPAKNGTNPVVIIVAGVIGFIIVAAIAAILALKLLGNSNAGSDRTKAANEETQIESYAESSNETETAETEAAEETTEAVTPVVSDKFVGSWDNIEWMYENVNIATTDGSNYSIRIKCSKDGDEYVLSGYKIDDDTLACSGFYVYYDESGKANIDELEDGAATVYIQDGKLYLDIYRICTELEIGDVGSASAPEYIYYLPLSSYGNTGDSNSIIIGSSSAMQITAPLTLNMPVNVSESSYIVQESGGYNNTGKMAVDGDVVTSWQVRDGGSGDWISLNYQNEINVDVIKLNVGNWRSAELYQKNDRPKLIKLSLINVNQLDENGYQKQYTMYIELPDQMTEHVITLPESFRATNAEIIFMDAYKGTAYEDNCISEVQILSK